MTTKPAKAGSTTAPAEPVTPGSTNAPAANTSKPDTASGRQPFETRAGRTTKPTARSQGLSPYVKQHIPYSWAHAIVSDMAAARRAKHIAQDVAGETRPAKKARK